MEKIKTGDMLHIGINSDGKYAVRLADSDSPANAYAAEDITGPDISWNQKTGEVFNFPVMNEAPTKQKEME